MKIFILKLRECSEAHIQCDNVTEGTRRCLVQSVNATRHRRAIPEACATITITRNDGEGSILARVSLISFSLFESARET